MGRYHINNNGESGGCNAEPGNCPFGGEANHYPTPEAARQAYEFSMASQTLPPGHIAPRPVDQMRWVPEATLRSLDSSLSRPDIDYGFHWASPDGATSHTRVSLAKWDTDETGTLYAAVNGQAAILAHHVTQDQADAAWDRILKRGGNPSVEEFVEELRS